MRLRDFFRPKMTEAEIERRTLDWYGAVRGFDEKRSYVLRPSPVYRRSPAMIALEGLYKANNDLLKGLICMPGRNGPYSVTIYDDRAMG